MLSCLIPLVPDEYLQADVLVKVARALSATDQIGEAERVASAITVMDPRAEALAGVARALAAAGNIGEAERIACQVLLTDRWPLTVEALLDDRLVKAAVNTVDGWLTTEFVTDFINSISTPPG